MQLILSFYKLDIYDTVIQNSFIIADNALIADPKLTEKS